MRNKERRFLDTYSDLIGHDHLHELYDVFFNVIGFARHDISGIAGFLRICTMNLLEKIDTAENIDSDLDKDLIKSDILEISKQVDELRKFLYVVFSIRYADQNEDYKRLHFSTRPSSISEVLVKEYKSVNIKFESNFHGTLEVLYPENVLVGMIVELMKNAIKAQANHILIQWDFTDFWLKCNIHDDGQGCSSLEEGRKIQVYDFEQKGNGLGLIANVISRSSGIAYIQNSNVLSGLWVSIEFPIRAFYTEKSGTTYAR